LNFNEEDEFKIENDISSPDREDNLEKDIGNLSCSFANNEIEMG